MKRIGRVAVVMAAVAVLLAACQSGQKGENGDKTAPEVSITAPASGAVFSLGQEVTFEGEANDDVGVVEVELFANDSSIGSATIEDGDWTLAWTPEVAAAFSVHAVASDAAGNSDRSEAIEITVRTEEGGITGDLLIVPPIVPELGPESLVTAALPGGARQQLPAPNKVMVLLADRSGMVLPARAGVERVRAAQREVESLARQHGFRDAFLIAPELGFAVMDAPAGASLGQTVRSLASDSRVRLASPVRWLYPAATPNDSLYSLQWALDIMDAPVAWNDSAGSSDVVVAVVDSGVGGPVGWNATPGAHPDLLGNLLPGYDFVTGYDLLAMFDDPDYPGDAESLADRDNFMAAYGVFPELQYLDADPDPGWDPFPTEEYELASDFTVNDFGSHGLHVAGIIGAAANNDRGVAGVNWDVSILPLRALGTAGGLSSDVLSAVMYAAGITLYDPDSGDAIINPTPARVINLSLGGAEGDAVENAIFTHIYEDRDVLVVAAAGNAGVSLDETQHYPSGYPAVMAVSSVDYIVDDGGQPATAFTYAFSNYGSDIEISAPGGFCWNNSEAYMTFDLAEGLCDAGPLVLNAGWSWFEGTADDPGDLVRDDSPAYMYMAGTSMSTPHVVGAAALALSIDPSLSAPALRELLRGTARRIDDAHLLGFAETPEDHDLFYGSGVVDLTALVRAATTGAIERLEKPVRVRAELPDGERFEVEAAADLTFELTNLPAGDYTISAGVDANGNGELGDSGEYFGKYLEPVTVEEGDSITGDVSLILRRLP